MPASEKTPTVLHYIEYAAMRGFTFLLTVLPLCCAVRVGRLIGWLFCVIDARHRRRVEEQMTFVFGDTHSSAEIREFARGMYRHFGTMLAEIVRVRNLTIEQVDTCIDWGGHCERLQAVLDEGKGIIFVTGHIGNWEVGGAATHLKGLVSGAIARPLDNPLIDAYIMRLRQHCGQKIHDKFGALKAVMRTLKKRGGFGMLLDQDGGQRGEFVPFFGKAASTLTTAADIAMRTGAPIVVAALHRADRPMQFIYRASDVIRVDPKADPVAERERLLLTINQELETLIRAAPEQWLWVHRRWKTRPAEALSGGA